MGQVVERNGGVKAMRAIIYFTLDGEDDCMEFSACPGDTPEAFQNYFYLNLLFAPDKCELIGAEIWRE